MAFGVRHGFLSRQRDLNAAGTFPSNDAPIGISAAGAAISWFGAKQWTLQWALADYAESIVINVEDFQFRPGQGYTVPFNGVTEMSGSVGESPDPNSIIIFFGGGGFFTRHDDLYWPPIAAGAFSGDESWEAGLSTVFGDPIGTFHMPGGTCDLRGFNTSGDAFLRITQSWT